jgi:hypothetical protein
MYDQMIPHYKTMMLWIRLKLSILNGLLRASPDADRYLPFLQTPDTVITPGNRVGNHFGKDRTERTSITARITGDTSQIVSFDDSVLLFLKCIVRTAFNARRLITLTTRRGKLTQFAKMKNPIVERMIEITARRLACLAFPTEFQIDEQPLCHNYSQISGRFFNCS